VQLHRLAASTWALCVACSDAQPGLDARVDRGPDATTDARIATEARARDMPRESAPLDVKQPDQPRASGPLRVITLNLHCLEELPDKRAQGIAAEIQRLDADAVALQEICEKVGAGGGDNLAAKIAAALKGASGREWQFTLAKTHVSWESKYPPGFDEGIGILAPKGSILASGAELLYQAKDFPRKVAWARVSSARGAFYLYSTHLTISSDWTERVKQVQSILAVVNAHLGDGLPQIVAGDFNDKDWSGPIQTMKAGPPAFTDAWAAKNPGQPGSTIACPSPSERIDYIFVRSAALKSLARVEKLSAQYQSTCLSDHVGLFAELYQQ
jgi:endonuclease/exonuclease/phosphatase family metal-dependent hydrolase